MVNIPKIVLKSQTRLTLNERFTQFAEQQEARLQMLKNDIRTRLVEESYQTGTHDSAELSEKLDRLTRDIDNPERLPALFSKKKQHRPRERHRSRDSDDNGRAEVSHWRAEALRGVEFSEISAKNSQKYVNPLYRDSDEEDTAESGGGSGSTSVHSRLGMKPGARSRGNVHKNRPNPGNFRRAGNRGNKFSGGASGSRQVVTKEDLDRELDEYRQKGISMDVEMGED